MTSRLPRRTAAVMAVTVAAFSGVALIGATSASAAQRAHTSLSIRTAKNVINPGGGDTISGTLRAPRHHTNGHNITLVEKASGATTWTMDATHRTNRRGFVTFQVSPTATTRYRLVFAGNNGQQPSHSGVVQVRVRADATSLTIAAASTSITAGQSDTISGVLSADGNPLAGDTVHLLGRRDGHGWTKRQSAVTAADGSVSFTVTPGVTNHYALAFYKNATNSGARSAIVTVHVVKTSSLSIRARSNHGKEIISGDLRGGGHALAHRNVTLQDEAFGTSTWTTVATKATGHNGSVNFSVPAPTANENYQLVFAGGGQFSGCQSGVVTVNVV